MSVRHDLYAWIRSNDDLRECEFLRMERNLLRKRVAAQRRVIADLESKIERWRPRVEGRAA